MASGPIKWRKSKKDFIESFHNRVIRSAPELKRSFTLEQLLEKYETDNDFKELVDSQNKEKEDKFIAHQKYAFSQLIENNPDHQSYAGKIGGPKGGKACHESMIARYGEDGYKKIMKSRYDSRDNTKFHSEGGITTGKIKAAKRDVVLIPIINSLPKNEWFDVNVLKAACKDSPLLNSKMKILLYHKDKITTNAARGSNVRYKIIAK